MPRAITSEKISKEWLKFDPDAIWDAEALPNATTKTSDEFMAGKDQGAIGIQVEAQTAISIADGQTLDINLLHAETSGGSTTSIPLFRGAPSGGTLDFAAGDEIVAYIPEDIGPYCKLEVTASADESSETINAYLRYLSR